MLHKLYDASAGQVDVKTLYNRIIVCCVDSKIHLKVPLYFVFDHKLVLTDKLK